jgi:7-cyano-7-deazaguanine synthase
MAGNLVLLSGGMDSTTVLYMARSKSYEPIKAISFDYGSKHNQREQRAAKLISSALDIEHTVIPLDVIANHFRSDLLKTGGDIPEGHYADPSMKRTVVPFRNGIMLSIAAGLAESWDLSSIWIANHFGDHAIYPDCRESFIEPMRKAIVQGTYAGIQLISPFSKMSKTDIASIGHELGVPWEHTYSCYNGGEIHCGKCGTCYERKEAFRESGVLDPTVYEV